MSFSVRGKPVSPVTLALARSRLGVWPLVFTVMAAAAPLTVVAGGATAGFAVTGITGIPVAYVVVALILAVFSVGFVAMSRKVVNAGAFYTYITHGLGKPLGVGSSFVAVAAYNLMPIGLSGGLGVAAHDFASTHLGVAAPWWMWSMAASALIAVLGGRRIDINGHVLAILLVAEILIAIVLAAVQVAHPADGHITSPALEVSDFSAQGAGAAMITAIAGFVGFEGTAVFGEESKDPQKTVARATYLALAIIGVLYAFCSWAMKEATGREHIVERATAEGSQLIFNLSGSYLPSFVITLGQFLFVTSLFAATLAFHNTAARYFYALGREGVLPAALGRISPKTLAPIAGSLTQSVFGFLGIAVFVLMGWDPFTRMFFWLTVLGGLGVLILMTATSVAVLGYFRTARRREGVGAGRGVLAPGVATFGLGAVLGVTLWQFATLLGVDADSPSSWQLPAIFAVAGIAGIIWSVYLKARMPQVYAAIGRGAHSTVETDVPLAAVRR